MRRLLFTFALVVSCSESEGPASAPAGQPQDTVTNDVRVEDASDALLDVSSSDADAAGASDGHSPDGPQKPPVDLRLNHLQAIGTHNSYHLRPSNAEWVPQWDYEHLPLGEQLGQQGVRQFELDIYWDEESQSLPVFHIPVLDELTNCTPLAQCAQDLKDWSDANPDHHPIFILLEPKFSFDEALAQTQLDALEAAIGSVWPKERLVTPDLVQGESENVRDALLERGWPTIDALRGRALFVLHTGGGFRDLYTDNLTSTAGRLFFPDAYGNVDHPISAVHSMNNPKGNNGERIREVVQTGHLVRTRADADSENLDYVQWEAAVASGAHFLSTDYPGEPYGDEYAVNIPEGTPSGCNPVIAPPECRPELIESLTPAE